MMLMGFNGVIQKIYQMKVVYGESAKMETHNQLQYSAQYGSRLYTVSLVEINTLVIINIVGLKKLRN